MAVPLTTHKRQGVRVAAIQSVKALMKLGAHEMILEITSFIHPNIVPIKVAANCYKYLGLPYVHTVAGYNKTSFVCPGFLW